MQAHQTALVTNAAVYADWQRMVSEFKTEAGFESIAAQIEDGAQTAIANAQELGIKIQDERRKDAPRLKQLDLVFFTNKSLIGDLFSANFTSTFQNLN